MILKIENLETEGKIISIYTDDDSGKIDYTSKTFSTTMERDAYNYRVIVGQNQYPINGCD